MPQEQELERLRQEVLDLRRKLQLLEEDYRSHRVSCELFTQDAVDLATTVSGYVHRIPGVSALCSRVLGYSD